MNQKRLRKIKSMSLVRTLASRGALSRRSACRALLETTTHPKLRPLATGQRLSSSLIAHVGSKGAQPVTLGSRAGLASGVRISGNKARSGGRVLRREQQIRSLGLFADGGGVSHRVLKELEKKAARSPSDPNSEVRRRMKCVERFARCSMLLLLLLLSYIVRVC